MGGLRTGVNSTQHYANGTPAVNAKFPDLKALVDYGHSKGVKMGFYLNGCACGERTEHLINYQGDVALTYTLGCDGGQDRLVRRSEEHDALQRAVQRHRASHHHQNFPDGGDPGQMGPGWCPYNFFRTSGDIINVWGRVIENLLSTTKFLSKTGQGVSPVVERHAAGELDAGGHRLACRTAGGAWPAVPALACRCALPELALLLS